MATNKTQWLLYITLSLLVIVSACSPIYYSPNTQHVPLYDEQGQASVLAGGTSKGGEIQASYAVSDHWLVLVDGAYFYENDEEDNDNGNGVLGEVGGGYFHPFAQNFVWGTNGLVGYGRFENNFPSIDASTEAGMQTGYIRGNVSRVGVQPYLGFKTTPFEVVASTRLVNLNYSNVNGNLPFEEVEQVQYLRNNSNQWQLEPSLTVRAGYRFAYAQIQWLKSFNLNDSDFRYREDQISLGLMFYLGRGKGEVIAE